MQIKSSACLSWSRFHTKVCQEMIGTQLRNCDFFSTIFVGDTIQIPLKGPWKVDFELLRKLSETNENPTGIKKIELFSQGTYRTENFRFDSLKPLFDRHKNFLVVFYSLKCYKQSKVFGGLE